MRRQLVLVGAATTTLIMLAFVIPLALLVRTVAEDRALTAARQVTSALTPTIVGGDDDALDLALTVIAPDAPGPVTVLDPRGRLLGPDTVADEDAARALGGEAFTRVAPDGSRLVVSPIFTDDGIAVVQVRVPLDRLHSGVTEAWIVVGLLGVGLVLGAVVVADRLGRTIVRPVEEVSTVARRLADGDLQARAHPSGPPEVAEVGVALNVLADRINGLLVAEREAGADLSHRLRTPLTALRLDIDAVSDGEVAGRLLGDLAALERAVDRMILRSRVGASADVATDAAAVARDRGAFWAPLAEDEGRAIHIDLLDTPTWVSADPDDLAAALDALIGNVFQHTEPGTDLGLQMALVDQHVRIRVHDAGPGLPGPHVLERGTSLGDSTGLGLDIGRRLAEAAGGQVEIGTGPLGGAAVTLVLPVASPR